VQNETNLARCNCSYEPCSRKESAATASRFHLRSRELPLRLPAMPSAHTTLLRPLRALVEKGKSESAWAALACSGAVIHGLRRTRDLPALVSRSRGAAAAPGPRRRPPAGAASAAPAT